MAKTPTFDMHENRNSTETLLEDADESVSNESTVVHSVVHEPMNKKIMSERLRKVKEDVAAFYKSRNKMFDL
jgi:hypothetical protein